MEIDLGMLSSATNGNSRTLRTCFLQIGTLNAFAVAQPIFDRMISNPQYLRLEGYSGFAIIFVVSMILLAIPLMVTASVATLRLVKLPKLAAAIFSITGTLLAALVINIAFRWLQWRFNLRTAGVPDMFLASLSLPLAVGCAWVYGRLNWPRQILNLAAIGIVLFPLNLLSTPAMRVELLGIQVKKSIDLRADNPVPIVMIVFDGLCSMALLNERHEIDAVRYPSFARLANQSTFYRNATSVHSRTAHALPAILTGQLPRPQGVSPIENEYPANLFRLIHDTEQYDLTVFEPVTFLCPTELRQLDQTMLFTEQVTRLTDMLLRVYVATTVPADFDVFQHLIPKVWFGFPLDESGWHRPAKGLVRYSWDQGQDVQADHFTRTLKPTEKPGFHFLHLVIPHDPWCYLPSGKSYLPNSGIEELSLGTHGSGGAEWGNDELFVNLGWQRYLLQLQFADRCLGKILDQLEVTGEFNRSLLVVVADHGMAFVAGQDRRTPANETLADLMSVPLFIKTPQQSSGHTTDRSVETIDVLPTIADVIQMPLASVVDGASLIDENVAARPRKTMHFDYDQVTVMNPEFPQRFNYVTRMLAVFGSGSDNDRMWKLDTIPALVGIDLAACDVGVGSRWTCRLIRGGEKMEPTHAAFVPCYFLGRLVGPKMTQPVEIAIALNGRIECTTRTCLNAATSHEWTALLRDDLFQTGLNKLQFYEVEQTADGFRLHDIAY